MKATAILAGKLKVARINADMGLSEAAQEAGFTEAGLRCIENGEVKRPSFLQVMRLCKLYRLDPWSLVRP